MTLKQMAKKPLQRTAILSTGVKAFIGDNKEGTVRTFLDDLVAINDLVP
jgi:hypothetical protein